MEGGNTMSIDDIKKWIEEKGSEAIKQTDLHKGLYLSWDKWQEHASIFKALRTAVEALACAEKHLLSGDGDVVLATCRVSLSTIRETLVSG